MKRSIYQKTTDIKEMIRIVSENMIKTRPYGKVVYRPFKLDNVSSEYGTLCSRTVDIKKVHKNAQYGDIAYVGTVLESISDYRIKLTIEGNVKVIYKNAVVYDYCENNIGFCYIDLKKGENAVLFKVVFDEEYDFKFKFRPSTPSYGFMWAKDYLLNVRATSPVQYYKHEDGVGISKLYKKDLEFDGEYVYPMPEKKSYDIDFLKIFGGHSRGCAYAVTYAEEDTNISLNAFSNIKAFVNGTEVSPVNISLKKNDVLLVKSGREENFGFSFSEAKIGIPFLQSSRTGNDKWLILGTFGDEGCFENSYGPEIDLQFTAPYYTEKWGRTFWRLNASGDYIRPYMDTCFFSQWFYALMVGHYGLLQASELLHNNEYKKYFIDSIGNLATYYEYMKYEKDTFGQPTFIQKGMNLNNLDSIGTMGMNLCELYKIDARPQVRALIEILERAMMENIPRLEDGTFARPRDMWTDDTFMSCPFLVRIGLIKNDSKYFEEAVKQLLGFWKMLWLADKKLFSHIYFRETNKINKVTWGRGNGWIYLTLSDVLEKIPDDIEGKRELIGIFKEFSEGIANVQDKSGMWHQVLTREDSYLETSCSAMFIIGLCRGVKYGWIDDKYKDNIMSAVEGLTKSKIDERGNIYDVCKGSGNSMDEEYYVKLATIDNDDHGTGVILVALSEAYNLLK